MKAPEKVEREKFDGLLKRVLASKPVTSAEIRKGNAAKRRAKKSAVDR